ncbi:hypothetical protein [Spirulina major]|uniref:hypothetical protein n=1 Tax=Spirulina major TaxID=270636 RepID=UPI00093444D3|nr:hypothetical protein [Spirulina major]
MTISPPEPVDLALPEQLLETLGQYAEQESLSLDRAMQIALHDFLVRQGYVIEPRKRLRITPATQGSGFTDTSVNHDAVFSGVN